MKSNKFKVVSLCVAATLALTACEAAGTRGNKQAIGGVGGAVLGGLAGSQIGGGSGRLVAVGVGTLLGALVGSEIGSSLDKADLAYANQAMGRAHTSPMGQTISWNNPQSGNSGTYTAVNDGYSNSGQYCRQYKQSIVIEGRTETGYGTACKAADGSWQIVNS